MMYVVGLVAASIAGFIVYSGFFAVLMLLDVEVDTLSQDDLDDVSNSSPWRGITRTLVVFVTSASGITLLLYLFADPTFFDGLIVGGIAGVFLVSPAAFEVLSGLNSRPKPILESVAWPLALLVQGFLIGLIA